MLRTNVINPKYRKLVWGLILTGITATWIPTIMKIDANLNGVSFTHFDQELAISCILDETALGVEWSCKKNQAVDLMRFNPEPKYWIYESKDGEVKVTRSINLGVAKFVIEHPSVGESYSTNIE